MPSRPAVLLAVFLLAACTPMMTGTPDPHPELAASLQVTPAEGTVAFALQVTNASDTPVELVFPTGQSFDFLVLRDGQEVWRWSLDRMFTQAIREETLPPGETLHYRAEWDARAARPGEYRAVGRLTSTSHPVEQSSTFTLP